MQHERLASLLLRIGLAVTFLYAAIASLLDPVAWIGFLPVWLRNLVPAEPLLIAFSLYEIALALWLLCRKYTFYAALAAAATLGGIIIFNIGALDILFRDVAILFAALGLTALHYNER